jgi:hypothetical protein
MMANMDDRIHFERTDPSKNILDDSIDDFTIRMPSLLYESRKRQWRPGDDIVNDSQQTRKKSTYSDAALDAPKLPAKPIVDDHKKNDLTLLLPDDLLAHVSTFLNVGSLKTARLACRRFNRVLSTNSAGWVQHCHRLWNRKVHVSRRDFDDHDGNSTAAMEAYRQSCFDARLRHVIRREELIYDPTRHGGYNKGSNHHDTIWSFRFKESAGPAWTRFDPWHNHHAGRARRMVFLPNGQVAQVLDDYARPGNMDVDEPDSRYSGPLKLCRPFSDDGGNDSDNEDSDDDDDAEEEEENNAYSGLDIRWRIVTQPMDLPPRGGNRGDDDADAIAYITLTVAGRDVPTYIVHRSPTGNWGFLMENCWGVFASFPLPCKKKYTAPAPSRTDLAPGAVTSRVKIGFPSFPQPQAIVPSERNESSSSSFSAVGDGAQQLLSLPQLFTGSNNNEYSATGIDDTLFWMDEDSENDGPDDGRLLGDFSSYHVHGQSSASAAVTKVTMTTSKDHLLDDAFLTVTNHWQWREALLYNMGSTTRLPDGPHALVEFDRICNLASRTRGVSMTTNTAQPYSSPAYYSYHPSIQQHDPVQRQNPYHQPHQH